MAEEFANNHHMDYQGNRLLKILLTCLLLIGIGCWHRHVGEEENRPETEFTSLEQEEPHSSKDWYCKEGKQFGKHCYKYYSTPSSWQLAKFSCETMGSELASIQSKSEEKFLEKLATPPYWIGLTDAQSEGHYLWTDGQTPTYTNWSPGEPNNDKQLGENCVEVQSPRTSKTHRVNIDGKWNDESCDRLKPFVCKKVAARICPPLPSYSFPYGRIDLDYENSLVKYTCNDGYRLIGNSTRQCQYSGEWSGSQPSCEIIDCGCLSNPDHGAIQVTKSVFNSTASLTCDIGYILTGHSITTCQQDGTWSPFGQCERIDCGRIVPEDKNLIVSLRSTKLEAKAQFTCPMGYEIDGPLETVCAASGTWSGPFPTCNEESTKAKVN
jgi:hypothetical protein